MHEAIIEYVSNCRVPMSPFEVAADLANLGNHGGNWPRASAETWNRAIEAALKDGAVRLDSEANLRLPEDHESGVKQLSLF